MKNQLTQHHFNSFFNSFPREIVFNEFLSRLSTKAALSLSRTNKNNYTEFSSKFIGLWNRDISQSELIQIPLLPALKLIDGCRRLSSTLELCNKNKLLFNPTLQQLSLEYPTTLFNNISSTSMVEDMDPYHPQIKAILNQATSTEYEISRYSGLNLLYSFMGLLGGVTTTIAAIIAAWVTHEILSPFFKPGNEIFMFTGLGTWIASVLLWCPLIRRVQDYIPIGNLNADKLGQSLLVLTFPSSLMLFLGAVVLELLIRTYYRGELSEKETCQTIDFVVMFLRKIY